MFTFINANRYNPVAMLKPRFDFIFSVHTSVQTPIFALLVMSCTFSSYVTATNYYVNDASSTGHTYCTAIGSNSNNGWSAGFPKLTLKNEFIY